LSERRLLHPVFTKSTVVDREPNHQRPPQLSFSPETNTYQ
jgi:hypothetical protein